MKPRLVLFDLDNTLLDGDSDVLWCEFLMDRGVLDRASFESRNVDMETRYQAGTVGVEEFAHFYVGTLGGKSRAQWEPLRREFLRLCIAPRIPQAAMELVERHREAGDTIAMTTATNRYITELTARHFGIDTLLATEPELRDGVFTGRTVGTLNMREGKVTRLGEWLAGQGRALGDFESTAYSDSMNDRPLLEAVDEPVAVNPDERLAVLAAVRGWRVIHLR